MKYDMSTQVLFVITKNGTRRLHVSEQDGVCRMNTAYGRTKMLPNWTFVFQSKWNQLLLYNWFYLFQLRICMMFSDKHL